MTVNMSVGDAERTVNDATVEINIGIQSTLNEVLIVQGNFFQLLGDVKHRIVDPQLCQNIVCGLFDDAGPRVKVLVDAVTKAHETEAVRFVLRPVNPRLKRGAFRTNGFEHFDDRLVGSSVKGPPKCGDTSRNGTVQVCLR